MRSQLLPELPDVHPTSGRLQWEGKTQVHRLPQLVSTDVKTRGDVTAVGTWMPHSRKIRLYTDTGLWLALQLPALRGCLLASDSVFPFYCHLFSYSEASQHKTEKL